MAKNLDYVAGELVRILAGEKRPAVKTIVKLLKKQMLEMIQTGEDSGETYEKVKELTDNIEKSYAEKRDRDAAMTFVDDFINKYFEIPNSNGIYSPESGGECSARVSVRMKLTVESNDYGKIKVFIESEDFAEGAEDMDDPDYMNRAVDYSFEEKTNHLYISLNESHPVILKMAMDKNFRETMIEVFIGLGLSYANAQIVLTPENMELYDIYLGETIKHMSSYLKLHNSDIVSEED